MAFSEKLQFIIDANGSGAIKVFNQVGDAADKNLGASTTATSKFGNALDGLAAKSPTVSKAFSAMGTDGQALASTIGTALPGAALAAGAGIGAFAVKAFSDFQDLAGSVRDFQRVAGTTAEESSRLVAVLDDFEVPADLGAKAMARMARVAADSPAEFQKYGVEIAKNADGTTNLQQTLLNAAEAYQTTNDDARKAALGAALFGKGYQDLIPILEKGADGADGLAASLAEVSGQQIMSQDQLDQAEDTRLALDRLSDAANEVMLAVGSGLSPVVEDFANSLADVTDVANQALGPIGGLDSAVGLLTERAKFALAPHVALFGVFKDLTSAGPDISAGITAIAEAQAEQAEAADSVALAENGVVTAALQASEATKTLEKASKESERAAKEEADALRDAADAALEKADAARDAADGTLEARDAARHFDEVLQDETASVDDGVRAASDLADRLVDVANNQATAEGRTRTATEKLDDWNGRMLGAAGTANGPLRTAILNYIGQVNQIPPEKVSEILALIDQGKLAEAHSALNGVSRSRESTITADAHTAAAESNLNHTARDRTARINVVTVGGGGSGSGSSNEKAFGASAFGTGRSVVNNFYITATGGLGSSGAQLGNEIANALKAWEKINGPIFSNQ